MTDSAKPTASEREALIAWLEREAATCNEPRYEIDHNHLKSAAAELSRLAAENERLRKIEERANEAVRRYDDATGHPKARAKMEDALRRMAQVSANEGSFPGEAVNEGHVNGFIEGYNAAKAEASAATAEIAVSEDEVEATCAGAFAGDWESLDIRGDWRNRQRALVRRILEAAYRKRAEKP